MEVLSELFQPQDGMRRERRTFTQIARSVKLAVLGCSSSMFWSSHWPASAEVI